MIAARATFTLVPLIVSMLSLSTHVAAQETAELREALRMAQEEPSAIEVYYEITDGFEEEFLELYKKNHWPVLHAEIEERALISVDIDVQEFAPPGGHKWDFRVTMVFTNMLYRHGLLERSQDAIIDRLYPDRELFDQEEQRRMELIEYGYILDRVRLPTAEWLTESPQQ